MPDADPATPTLTSEQKAEHLKVGVGVFKHMVTLDTAALGFFAGFMATVQGGEKVSTLFLIAAILIWLSLLGSLALWIQLALDMPFGSDQRTMFGFQGVACMVMSFAGFVMGVTLLVLPAWLSLF